MVLVEVRARIDKKFVESAVDKATKLIKPPKNLKVFIIDKVNQCPFVAADLKGFGQKAYEKFCRTEKTSMSVTTDDHEHVIVFITKDDAYLRTNKTALIGTLIHELMHTYQRRKKIDDKIFDDLNYVYSKWWPKFRKLDYNKKELRKAILDILDEAGYALKDIYDNRELIRKGLGKYILEDYSNLYGGSRTCPKPLEFQKLHGAVRKRLDILPKVMNFQVSLLAVVIPFEMWHKKKAEHMADRLERCYGISLTKVTYEFDDLINFVKKNYGWEKSFRRKFFNMIMQKTYSLLT